MSSKEIAAGSDFPSGLSQPALRALSGAGIERLEKLAERTETEVKQLHGMGPKGIRLLVAAMHEKGLSFREK